MRFRTSSFGLRICLAVLLFPLVAAADSSALILNGPSGVPEDAEKFAKWVEGTRKLLVDQFGFAANRVIALSETKTARADIESAFGQLKQQIKPGDNFFLFLIGRGSFDVDYKFNNSGPDLTAADFSKLLSSLGASRVVVINSTNSSGGSIESLAGKNRVIVTATRTGSEGNQTVFFQHFLTALQNADSDEDKDKKVSVWEAFKYTVASVERFYKEEGLLVTEHAQISDNGGAKTGATVKELPVIARMTAFQVDRPIVVADAKLQALLNEKKEIEQKIEALRINKAAMSESEYEKQLEELATQLALKNQTIREQEKK